MASSSLLLFETGFNLNISLFNQISSGIFPVWGNFMTLDFFMAQILTKENEHRYLFLDNTHKSIQPTIQSRYKYEGIKIVTSQSPVETVLDLLEFIDTETILLATLANTFRIDTKALDGLIKVHNNAISKIALNEVPLDLYICDRKNLIKLLKSFKTRSGWQESLSRFIFEDILHSHFDDIINLPGDIILKSNLMHIYDSQLDIIKFQQESWYYDTLFKLNELNLELENSHITNKGHVINSVLFSGVEVEGFVENSVLFPGVKIKKNARISNSVIMNNNQVGRNTVIKHTLILPYQKEFSLGTDNIDEAVFIGGTAKQVKNQMFPEQIHSGLTVIGINAEIPRGTTIEQGCFIDNNLSAAVIKQNKHVKKGCSLILDKAS